MADTPIAAEDLPLAEFIRQGNAAEQGVELPTPAPVPEPEPEPTPEPEPAAVEAVADDTDRDEAGKFKAKKGSPQERINKAIAKQREAERRASELETEIATLKAKPAPVAAPAPVEAPPPSTAADRKKYLAMPGAPDIKLYDGSDGKTYEDYMADVAEFIADKRFDEKMTAHDQRQAAQREQDAWFGKLDTAMKADPTLKGRLDTLRALDAQIAPSYIPTFIRKSEIGVDILAHLADHPDIAQRLPTLHPLQQAEELGKIEATLSAKRAAPSGPAAPSVISQAQPPIKPVGSSPPVSDDDVAEEDLPLSTFFKRGNARESRSARH